MLWRTYHAERLVDMVVQVWMTEEFTSKRDAERVDYWGGHLNAMNRHRVRIGEQMWKRLEPYITAGSLLNLDLQE